MIRIISCHVMLIKLVLHRHKSAKIFADAGIPTALIHDCAIGYTMEQVDLCITGAEGVMENGGIVNKVRN